MQQYQTMLVPSYPYTLGTTVAAGLGVIAMLFPQAPRPTVHVEPARPTTGELQLVFEAAGATYMQLSSEVPAHEPPVLFDRTAIAKTDAGAHRHWLGRSVIVDGTCRANVVGFAVVARVTGTADYAPGAHAQWTASNVFEHGAPVLAAKLDGCSGTIARDAELSPIVVPKSIDDDLLAKRARMKFLASGPAHDAQYVWEADGRKGKWHASKEAKLAAIVFTHHGSKWVSVHGKIDEGCGGPEINLYALYRGDELATVEQRDLGDLWSIDSIIDIENDGRFELVGTPWLANDVIVTRANGDEITRLELPYYGCPC